LVVDERGRPLLAVSRVARTARRDDDFSDALPVLALLPLVALVALLSVGTRVAVLSATALRAVSVTETVIPPCVPTLVRVLVVDDRGRPLLAVTRVARTARRDDDFSEALPMLALLALVPLVAVVPLVAMVPLVALRPIGAVLPVLSRGAVLSATDYRGITVTESVIHP